VRKRLAADRATALASLWEKAGGAIDLAMALRKQPDDPRHAYVDELLTAAQKVNDLIGAHDLEGATNAARPLDRLLRRADELYLVPFLQKAGKFSGGKKTTNAITQAIDDALKLLGVNASTHEIKRQVSKSAVVRFEDTDGSLEWIDQYGKERTISHHGFENRVSERRKKIRSP
jgi:hypothetical protein